MVKLSEVISPAFYTLHRQIASGNVGEAVCQGGRGSAKSSFVGIELVLFLLRHPQCHAVVLRKVDRTLRTSVYAQIRWTLGVLGLVDRFRCTISPMQMVYMPTGQTIYFFGLDDPMKLKSFKTPFGYVGCVWFEELDQFAGDAEVRNLEQSMLRGGDEFLTLKSFNPPPSPRNWANQYVLGGKSGQIVHRSTYLTTPRAWLGERFILDAEDLMQRNPTLYQNEYLGEVVGSGTQVFTNLRIEPIEDAQIETFARVYRGVDWGFYPDPFAYNEVCYDAARRTLYIFGEITARRMGNMQTAELVRARGRYELITADSAEPKSVSDFASSGLPCVGAKKGPGSVEHGMKWLQSLDAIVIDPARCPDTCEEFSTYEYAADKDGSVLDGYPDYNNHHIDAVRYALEAESTRRVAVAGKR